MLLRFFLLSRGPQKVSFNVAPAKSEWNIMELELKILLLRCKLTIHPNDQKFRLLSNESKSSIRQWVLAKSFNNKTRKCTGASRAESSTGFRQRNIANFRKGSMISFVGQQQLFVKDSKQQSDTERLKRLEFNVQQIDKKMNELDLKLDTILKTILRPDSPDNM